MRKFAIAVAMVATLAGNGAYAQSTKPTSMSARTGSGAQAGTYTTSNFAWGIGLGALVALGLVVGLTVGAATGSQNSH